MANGQAGTQGTGVQAATFPFQGEIGIRSIDDMLKSRAMSLTGLQRQFSYWSDPFMTRAGRPGSLWGDFHAVDSGSELNDHPGGVVSIFANSGYGGWVIDSQGNYPLPSVGSTWIGTVAQDNPFYVFWRFLVSPDPGTGGPGGWVAGCSMVMGLVDPHTLECAGIGVGVAGTDTPNFQGIGGNINGTNSTLGVDLQVPLDFNVWHNAEMFYRLGHWWAIIDEHQPVDISSVITMTRGIPVVQVMTNKVLQPQIVVDHCAYVAKSNMPQMAVYPKPPFP